MAFSSNGKKVSFLLWILAYPDIAVQIWGGKCVN
jgi:hypothetical protein